MNIKQTNDLPDDLAGTDISNKEINRGDTNLRPQEPASAVINEYLLVEYEKAQDSAQHHDNLIWSVSTLTWGVSSVLLGFVLTSLETMKYRMLLMLFCVLGIFIILCAWYFTVQFRSIRGQKYKRCKELEKIFSFNQHSNLMHRQGSQIILYSAVMVLFLSTWVMVFLKVFLTLFGVAITI